LPRIHARVSKYDDTDLLSLVLSNFIGMLCAYPLLVVSTCMRAGLIKSSIKDFFRSFSEIVARNGLAALWWGLVPYMVVCGLRAGASLLLDNGAEYVEEKLFPNQETDSKHRTLFGYGKAAATSFAKAAVIAVLVCPFEAILYRTQASSAIPNAKTVMVGCGLWGVKHLWQQGGFRAFFNGLQLDFWWQLAHL